MGEVSKVVLVGLDGAEWRVLWPLLESGRMPRLQGLINNGDIDPFVLAFSGTVVLNDGVTTRGIVWTTTNFTDWTAYDFQPLVGFGSSVAGGGGGGGAGGDGGDGGTVEFGSSCAVGDDPLRYGVATKWQFTYQGELRLVTNVRDLALGLPADAQLTTIKSIFGPPDCNSNGLLGTYVFSEARDSRGTPEPHAAVLFAQPQRPIPAVSQWGMVAMMMLVLTAGTLVFIRRRASRVVA